MPEITGDTANGRSMSVSAGSCRGKSNLRDRPAAQTPNTRLAGTAIAAASSVSRSAASASGSRIDRSDTRPSPRRKRLDEHDDQRQDEEQAQEEKGDDRERPPHQARLGQLPAATWRPCRHARARIQPRVRRQLDQPSRLLQPCSALIASSSMNDISSMTSAIAVAPA